MSVIEVTNLYKKFGEKEVIKSTSFSVKKGEILGIIGPSGCGKSVLIKILIGFLKPDSGKIEIDKTLKIGFSMQNNSIYKYLTVKQNLKYFAKLYKVPRKGRKEMINALIKNLELEEYKKSLVKNLSGGTQKRVDIACSLLNDPAIVILDEPFAGLDPDLIKRFASFILSLKKRGKTIVISSHRISELNKISSRTITIKKR
jgi:ABC-2 type transport system ATP-binding protein